MSTLLIVDDDQGVHTLLAMAFSAFNRSAHSDLGAARRWVEEGHSFDVALVDKNLPDGEGLDFIKWLRERAPTSEALLMTADATLDSAILAMQYGACDYLKKPFDDIEQVRLRVRDAFEKVALKHQKRDLLARVQHVAMHDAVTGLANRYAFLERLAATLSERERNMNRLFALLFVDVDRFKGVNDNLGHSAGDELLRGLADRLRQCVRNVDTVARIGGDEFTVLLREVREPKDALRVAERIHDSLKEAFTFGRQSVYASVSIGVALSHDQGSPDNMLREADQAMYRAKHLGRARTQIFDLSLQAQAQRAWQLESELRSALGKGEVTVAYQPIIDLSRNQLAGFEALVRWTSPVLGVVPPVELIPVAEESSMIDALFDHVLDTAGRQLRAWQREHKRDDLFMCVNLSGKQLADAGLVDRLLAKLQALDVSPHALDLEITESVLMDDRGRALASLERLREAGVRLSIDDFGTGYSSLSYLTRLPISTLKIDRSFVADIARDESRNIVSFIIDLARKLGLRVIAEGVEEEAQAHALLGQHCGLAQGYFYARPMAAEQMSQWLVASRAT